MRLPLVRLAERAKAIAKAFDYTDEYDEESVLAAIVADDVVPDEAVGRYLFIGVEEAGAGPAHTALFYDTQAEAKKQMGVYASEGWASFVWDLNDDTVVAKFERYPR